MQYSLPCSRCCRTLASCATWSRRSSTPRGGWTRPVCRTFKFEVSGHTDSSGNAARNKDLSQKRAQVIVKELVARGVPDKEIVPVGKGVEAPAGQARRYARQEDAEPPVRGACGTVARRPADRFLDGTDGMRPGAGASLPSRLEMATTGQRTSGCLSSSSGTATDERPRAQTEYTDAWRRIGADRRGPGPSSRSPRIGTLPAPVTAQERRAPSRLAAFPAAVSRSSTRRRGSPALARG